VKKRKVKMKMKEDYGDDIAAISNKPTPKLDALVKEVNKLLATGLATFIPKACRALKDD
jgi:phage host-nuclease inhibitor protein Gam